MPTLGDMIVKIVGQNAEFDSAVDKSEKKYQKFQNTLEKGGKTLTKFVTLPLLAAATAAVKFAIDADETAAKFGTAFRDVRKSADETARNLRDNFGMSTEESQRLLAGTGDLLKGFGATGAEALDLSDKVQRLSVDLASYNNLQGGSADASSRITRALLGEREALIGVGVKISEAAIEAERLARGTEDLTGKAKLWADAQITLDLIMAQSADAMGDFARTSESGANQMRILKARTLELLVTFGQQMLPTVTKIVGKVINLFESFANLSEGTKRFIIITGLVAAAIGPLMLITAKLITVFQVLRTAVIAAMIALKAMDVATKTTVAGLALAGIGLLVGAIIGFSRETKTAKTTTEDWSKAVDAGAKNAEEWTVALTSLMGAERQLTEQRLNYLIAETEAELAAERAGKARIGTIITLSTKLAGYTSALHKLGGITPDEETVNLLDRTARGYAEIDEHANLAVISGEEYNAIEEKRSLLLKTIGELIDKGVKIEDDAIQALLVKHGYVLGSYRAQIDAVVALAKAKTDADKAVTDAEKAEADRQAVIAIAMTENADFADALRAARVAKDTAAADEILLKWKWLYDEDVKAAQAAALKKKNIQDAWFSVASATISALASLTGYMYDEELAAAEGNDVEIRRIKREQAKATKLYAIFDIAIKTAMAVIGFLATLPPNVPGAIAAGITGAIQAAVVLAQPLPALARGGVIMPTPGGTPFIAGEAGMPEAIFPLDRLGEILSSIPNASAGGGESMIHLQVNMDSQPFLDSIFPASRNGRVQIDGRVIV